MDESVAKLLQTVKDANALIDDKDQKEEEEAVSSGLDDSSSDSSSDSEDGNPTLVHLLNNTEDDDTAEPTLATRNETLDPHIPELTIQQLPPHAQLLPLGHIHNQVDSSLTIQSTLTGEHQVLDTETAVLFEDRRVLGPIFDVFGPVSRPMYTIRFRDGSAMPTADVGAPVFYSPDWARILDTRKLRMVRGNDASNEYDEEVGDDMVDFSDDEQERKHKKSKKKQPKPPPPPPPPPPASTSSGGRQLQSYQDLYDPDLGF